MHILINLIYLSDNIDVAKILIENGANMSYVDKHGSNLLHWAAGAGNFSNFDHFFIQ